MRNIQWMTYTVLASAIYAGSTWAEEAASTPQPAPVSEAAAGTANAVLSDADGNALLKKNNCFACHAMDKKVVGPAFKDVAAKYRGQTDAEAALTTKVSRGGKGAWGSMVMPPQAAKADDITAMVRFVLAQK